MSDLAFLIPGPIQQICWSSAGEFDAMVSGSTLKPTFGLVVRSAIAPDVITYPIFKNFTWEDISSTPLVVRYWNSAMSSWDAQVPASGSIVNSMIANHTIKPIKFDTTGGNPGNVYRVNGTGTDVIFDDPQNLFSSASPLQVGVLSKSPVGSYVLVDNGVAVPSWALVSSLFTAGGVPLSAISVSGALSGQVLTYNGVNLVYNYPDLLLRALSLGIGLLTPGPANNIPIVNALGTAVTWGTPADIVAVLLPYVQSNYVTPPASYQAPPASTSSAQFAHGLGALPAKAGGFITCVTIDGGIAVGTTVPWDCVYTVGGGVFASYMILYDSTNIYLITPPSLGSAYEIQTTAGTPQAIDVSKWKVGAWAEKT